MPGATREGRASSTPVDSKAEPDRRNRKLTQSELALAQNHPAKIDM